MEGEQSPDPTLDVPFSHNQTMCDLLSIVWVDRNLESILA